MKTSKSLIALGLVAALTLVVGCDKKSEGTINDAAKAISDKTAGAAAEVSKAVDAAKPAAENAVGDAKAAVEKAATDAGNSATALIAQATSLVKDGKYSDALASLQKLTGMKLTPDQDKLVASLKEQIQKAMAGATDAAGAAGNLLKK